MLNVEGGRRWRRVRVEVGDIRWRQLFGPGRRVVQSRRELDVSVTVERRWSFVLDGRPEVVWATLVDTSSYWTWWPWLRSEDLPEVTNGAEASVTISPSLPYELDVHIVVTDVVAARRRRRRAFHHT